MDFLNPKKRRANKIRLHVGYVLMAILLVLATTVLLYQAYGYDLGKNGQVFQNGLLYLSSNPSSAQIYLNGKLASATTNARLELPAGQYTVKLNLNGYRSWQRAIGLEGGSVEHFDYPFLFPKKLIPATVQQYSAQPGLMTQSPDQKWLLVEQPGSVDNFTQYNLSNPKDVAANATTISLPANLLTRSSNTDQSLTLVGWADDDQHVIIRHDFGTDHEYILVDIATPSDSINLTDSLQLSSDDQLSLDNAKYNQYYVFNDKTGALGTDSLNTPAVVPLLKNVINFKTYGSDIVLYATGLNAPAKRVNIDVLDSGKNYKLMTEPAGTTYPLNITQYSGNWFVAAGAASDNRVYIYENPMADLGSHPNQLVVPQYILKINQPQSVTFSTNAQFIDAQSGANFAVYDAENEKGYSYKLDVPIQSGQQASWMDGYRLMIVSGGHLVVWDYDDANQQTLQPAVDGATAYFDGSYKTVYVLASAPAATNPPAGSVKSKPTQGFVLTETSLLAK